MEVVLVDPDDVGVRTHLVHPDEPVPAVEGGVLLRLGHHRSAGLGEADHELGAQVQELVRAARQLVEDLRRRRQRVRPAHVLFTGLAEGQRHHEVQGVQLVGCEVLPGPRGRLGDDLPL